MEKERVEVHTCCSLVVGPLDTEEQQIDWEVGEEGKRGQEVGTCLEEVQNYSYLLHEPPREKIKHKKNRKKK